MEKLKTIEVTIRGTTPLLCNRFTDEAQQKATTGTGSSLVGDRGTPREIAEGKLYTNGKGKTPIIPGPNMFRCIIDAGKYFKNGKSKVTTMKSSIIPACCTLNEAVIPIKHKDPWEVDSRPVRIPSTGGRIVAHRPMFHNWELSFTMDLDTEMISEKLLREIVDAGGKRIGLGDFRPDCKGPFGKFVVTRWK